MPAPPPRRIEIEHLWVSSNRSDGTSSLRAPFAASLKARFWRAASTGSHLLYSVKAWWTTMPIPWERKHPVKPLMWRPERLLTSAGTTAYLHLALAHRPRWRASRCMDSPTGEQRTSELATRGWWLWDTNVPVNTSLVQHRRSAPQLGYSTDCNNRLRELDCIVFGCRRSHNAACGSRIHIFTAKRVSLTWGSHPTLHCSSTPDEATLISSPLRKHVSSSEDLCLRLCSLCFCGNKSCRPIKIIHSMLSLRNCEEWAHLYQTGVWISVSEEMTGKGDEHMHYLFRDT